MKREVLIRCLFSAMLPPFLAASAGAQSYPTTPYVFTTLAGAAAIGSTDGPASAARFNFPMGIAADSAGNIYVTDTDNHTIRKISPAGVVSTLAGNAGYSVPATHSGNHGDGIGSDARFTDPAGLVVDPAGNVFVCGGDNAIRKITPTGVVTTLAGGGPISQFNVPQAITLDAAGNLYVADTFNLSIKKITPAGGVTTLAGGSWGSADGTGAAAQFRDPRGIAVDSAGMIYVADTFNHTIRRVTQAGVVTTIAGTAFLEGHADGVGTNAQFNYPSGLAIDLAGNLFVADYGNSTIRKITPAGTVTTVVGAIVTPGHIDGNVSVARFFTPQGVAVDPAGNLFVADVRDQTIRKVTPSVIVSTVAGLSPFQCNGTADGVGTAARFSAPEGLAVGPAGEIYVADLQNHTIRKVAANGAVSTLAGLGNAPSYVDDAGAAARFNLPEAVAVDAGGNVFVADLGNSVIRKITPAGMVSTIAGRPGIRGSTDGPFGIATLGYLMGVAVHPNGYLVACEDTRVRLVALDGTVTTLPVSSPQPYSYFGDVAVDPAGNIYVLDVFNEDVLKFTPPGTLAQVIPIYFEPARIAADRSSNIFVTGRTNHWVWKRATDGVLSLIGGLRDVRGSSDGVGEDARFENPAGVAVDVAGNVYVTCNAFNSDTVRKGQPAGPSLITIQPQSLTVARGSSVQFSVTAIGVPAPTYQWYFNGAPFNGATSNTLNFANAQPSDAGDYTVVVSNPLAAVTSSKATLTVGSTPADPGTPPTSGGSGGGAIEDWFVVGLAVLASVRRRRGAPHRSFNFFAI